MPYSFSEQRNFAIEQATGDWILSLDADETIDNSRYMTELIHNPANKDIVGFSFPTDHVTQIMTDQDPHVRLFRNRPDIRWEREIHEYLTIGGHQLHSHPAAMGVQQGRILRYQPEITVVHWSYTMTKKEILEKVAWYQKYNKLSSKTRRHVEEKTLLPANRIEDF